eukprot:CAMPEP_0177628700 /NCGR_PEP_ID=MMETSP0447-20121125/271_1 /TAXON_ID=0 /ORGANISM="Stygamoeba regulata, Strain BSH-02190019" /LENGTH=61 /DNA_ID=CAMNT_0019129965 /DNA_START=192 /DNA_END=377 /DNA_ORIENTATION=-
MPSPNDLELNVEQMEEKKLIAKYGNLAKAANKRNSRGRKTSPHFDSADWAMSLSKNLRGNQ